MLQKLINWLRAGWCTCDAYYGIIDTNCPVHYPKDNPQPTEAQSDE